MEPTDAPVVGPSEFHDDAPNARLVALVRTSERNLAPTRDVYDFVAIGGGTAGLVATAGASMVGAHTLLAERALLGGDCLVTGCVPSKALLHAARLAHDARVARLWGVGGEPIRVDFETVMTRLRETRAHVAEDDAIEVVRERGIDVVHGRARFVGPRRLTIGDRELRFKRALIATGGRPHVPSTPGLRECRPLTNESLFELTTRPESLLVIGGGPVGCEMAQAMNRLGVRVILVQRSSRLLPRDDPEASEILARTLRHEGVELWLDTEVVEARPDPRGAAVTLKTEEAQSEVRCHRILVATGRLPNVEELGLAEANVEVSPHGIRVDRRFRTTNRRIYAAGDVASHAKFTHAAWAEAEYATLNALFPLRLDVAARAIPWCTYTDPEIAHVGPSWNDLEAQRDRFDVLTVPLHDNDRATIEGDREGFARVHLRRGSDRIVAATIVSRNAGELISELTLAITHRLGLGKLTSVVRPYPTRSEMIRDLAYAHSTGRITPMVRRWTRRWFALLR